jgi:hypothetical protein
MRREEVAGVRMEGDNVSCFSPSLVLQVQAINP